MRHVGPAGGGGMEVQTPTYLWFLIPVLFIVFGSALWLGVTSMLGLVSGWFRLAKAFPDRAAEQPIERLGSVNGILGPISYKFALRLDVCPGGLRVGVTRTLGPFCKPFFVPWSNITAGRGNMMLATYYKLSFGAPPIGELRLHTGTAQKLAATGRLALP